MGGKLPRVPDLRLCSLTDHVMSQRFSHATIQRQILGFLCIWHMPQNMAIQKHMAAQWTVMSWCWLSGVLSLLAYQSFGLDLVQQIIIVTIRSSIGPLKSLALPLFHSLTRCDTTSQFLGCGKKAAWQPGVECRSSPTHYWFSHTTLTCSVSIQCIYSGYNPLSYSCTARGVVQIVAMKQGIVSSPLEADHWTIYPLHKLHCSSM